MSACVCVCVCVCGGGKGVGGNSMQSMATRFLLNHT